MADRSFIKLLRTEKIIQVKNNLGGYNTELDIKTYNELPTDYYEIQNSSN